MEAPWTWSIIALYQAWRGEDRREQNKMEMAKCKRLKATNWMRQPNKWQYLLATFKGEMPGARDGAEDRQESRAGSALRCVHAARMSGVKCWCIRRLRTLALALAGMFVPLLNAWWCGKKPKRFEVELQKFRRHLRQFQISTCLSEHTLDMLSCKPQQRTNPYTVLHWREGCSPDSPTCGAMPPAAAYGPVPVACTVSLVGRQDRALTKATAITQLVEPQRPGHIVRTSTSITLNYHGHYEARITSGSRNGGCSS
jgi:hypothetical protein